MSQLRLNFFYLLYFSEIHLIFTDYAVIMLVNLMKQW